MDTIQSVEAEKPTMRAVRESVYYLKALLLASGQEPKSLSLEEFCITEIDEKRYYRTQLSYLVPTGQTMFGASEVKTYKNVFLSVDDFELKSIETDEKA
ncbi:MAG: hypothetical protein NC218_03500 [Acetobacter sp.]|nr:hypothetical protein [Acetobacter sp.]